MVTAKNDAGTSVASSETAASLPAAILQATTQNGTLTLLWPVAYLGWQLQSNPGNMTNPSLWVDIPGTTTVIQFSVPVSPNAPAVFYRLRH